MDPEAILAAIEQQHDSDAEPREEQERVPYLGFYLGAEVYGLPLDQLREVARVSHLRRVPGRAARASRGSSTCAARFCARSTFARFSACPRRRRPTRPSSWRCADSAIRWVSSSTRSPTSMRSLPSEIEPPPATWPAERAACFIGTARVPVGLMGLLDLARVTKV